jgi:hypothetical protein
MRIATMNHDYFFQSTVANAWQEVIPDTPFRPIDMRIRCSLTGNIFFPCLSATSQAIEVNILLHAVATAELSGMN